MAGVIVTIDIDKVHVQPAQPAVEPEILACLRRLFLSERCLGRDRIGEFREGSRHGIDLRAIPIPILPLAARERARLEGTGSKDKGSGLIRFKGKER
jgi:hypothetical protein